MTLENCLTISITDLKKKGILNSNQAVEVLKLIKNNGQCLSVEVELISSENERHLKLYHSIETEINKTLSYTIKLISISSNIGNGFVTYFVCPSTGKHCRKLYSCGGKFQHRDATGLLYAQQIRKQPISCAGYLTIEQRNEPNTKYFRKYYKGEMTKSYFRILLRISHLEVVDAYYAHVNR